MSTLSVNAIVSRSIDLGLSQEEIFKILFNNSMNNKNKKNMKMLDLDPEILQRFNNQPEIRAEFIFDKDQDSHWYRINKKDKEEFSKLCDEAYEQDEFEVFEEKFGQCRIGCHPSNYEE